MERHIILKRKFAEKFMNYAHAGLLEMVYIKAHSYGKIIGYDDRHFYDYDEQPFRLAERFFKLMEA